MIGALAAASGAVTFVIVAGLDPAPAALAMATIYLGAGLAGLFRPLWVTAQTGTGQLLAAGLVVSGRASPIEVLPLVLAVVLNAELLGLFWMNAGSLQRERPVRWSRLARPTWMAAVAYAVVLWIGSLPGPSGLAAVVLASMAAGGAAFAMVLLARTPAGGQDR